MNAKEQRQRAYDLMQTGHLQPREVAALTGLPSRVVQYIAVNGPGDGRSRNHSNEERREVALEVVEHMRQGQRLADASKAVGEAHGLKPNLPKLWLYRHARDEYDALKASQSHQGAQLTKNKPSEPSYVRDGRRALQDTVQALRLLADAMEDML